MFNASKYFTINNFKKTGLKQSVNFFSVDYKSINTNEILDIHNWKNCCKIMFGIIKRNVFVLLASIVNGSNHTKCVSLINQRFADSTYNLHPNEHRINFATIHLWLN